MCCCTHIMQVVSHVVQADRGECWASEEVAQATYYSVLGLHWPTAPIQLQPYQWKGLQRGPYPVETKDCSVLEVINYITINWGAKWLLGLQETHSHTLPEKLSQQVIDGLLQFLGSEIPVWRIHKHLQPLQVDSHRADIGHSREAFRPPVYAHPTTELEDTEAPERGRVHDTVPVMANQGCISAIAVRKKPKHMFQAQIRKWSPSAWHLWAPTTNCSSEIPGAFHHFHKVFTKAFLPTAVFSVLQR